LRFSFVVSVVVEARRAVVDPFSFEEDVRAATVGGMAEVVSAERDARALDGRKAGRSEDMWELSRVGGKQGRRDFEEEILSGEIRRRLQAE
jgi:hypothetical protein